MTTLVVAALSAREVARRRVAVALVVTLPLWFYLARRDLTGRSVRMLTLGIGWSISTLTLFVVNGARGVDPRLRLTGASVAGIVGGRLLAMTGLGAMLGLGYWLLVAADQPLRRPWATGLMMLLTALVAAPLGNLLAALLPRELEGALALFSVVAVQMLADPDGTVARLMPFWSVRELGTYAIDGTGTGYLRRALAHAALTWTVCTAGSLILSGRRLQLARYSEP
jgi:hypothetical protein